MFDEQFLQEVALYLPALFISFSVHEYAHARAAVSLGDNTPLEDGRLTLSPFAHLDLFGSVLFPLILLFTSGMSFGWAKPVRFQPHRFSRGVSMRTGAAITAVAGPLSNVLLALVTAVAIRFASSPLSDVLEPKTRDMVLGFLSVMFSLNILLAAFNLFPMPPLDGGYLLPRSLDRVRDWVSRNAMVVFVLLFFIPVPPLGKSVGFVILDPVQNALGAAVMWLAFFGA